MKKNFLMLMLCVFIILPCGLIFSACNEPPRIEYQITITENENGEILVNKTNAYAGDVISISVNANEGYKLEEDSLKYNGIKINNFSFVMPEKDVVITANFIIKSFNINYHTDEFTTHSNPLLATTNDIIQLTNPTKSGYDFDGWYYDSTYNNKVLGAISNLNSDLNLYPKFNKLFIINNSYNRYSVVGLTNYAQQKDKLTIPANIDGNIIDTIKLEEEYPNLKELTIESGIKNITSYSFQNCNNLNKITIPNTIICSVLPYSMFTGCSNLQNIIVENQNEEQDGIYVENNILYYKKSGKKFDPQQGQVQYTDIYMICYPSGLTNQTYTVPEGVTDLFGFSNAKFQNLYISSTVNTINNLSNCTQIKNISVHSDNKAFLTHGDCLYYKDSNASYTLKLYYGNNTTLSVPSSIQIGNKITGIYHIESTALKNSNITKIISEISAKNIDLELFTFQPNLKFFSKQEKPNPSNWNEEDLYKEVLNCDNIYWYSEYIPSDNAQYWHYASDGITPIIW